MYPRIRIRQQGKPEGIGPKSCLERQRRRSNYFEKNKMIKIPCLTKFRKELFRFVLNRSIF